MVLADRKNDPALRLIGRVRMFFKSDDGQIVGIDLQLISGLNGGDWKREEAQVLLFQALQEYQRLARRVFQWQKTPAMGKAG